MLCTSVAYMESTTESSVYIIIMICKLHTTHFYVGKIYHKLGNALTFFCGGRGEQLWNIRTPVNGPLFKLASESFWYYLPGLWWLSCYLVWQNVLEHFVDILPRLGNSRFSEEPWFLLGRNKFKTTIWLWRCLCCPVGHCFWASPLRLAIQIVALLDGSHNG